MFYEAKTQWGRSDYKKVIDLKRPWTENILHIASKFQFNHTCFQGGEARVNFNDRIETQTNEYSEKQKKETKKESLQRRNNSLAEVA